MEIEGIQEAKTSQQQSCNFETKYFTYNFDKFLKINSQPKLLHLKNIPAMYTNMAE
jgi:hypothetical protein